MRIDRHGGYGDRNQEKYSSRKGILYEKQNYKPAVNGASGTSWRMKNTTTKEAFQKDEGAVQVNGNKENPEVQASAKQKRTMDLEVDGETFSPKVPPVKEDNGDGNKETQVVVSHDGASKETEAPLKDIELEDEMIMDDEMIDNDDLLTEEDPPIDDYLREAGILYVSTEQGEHIEEGEEQIEAISQLSPVIKSKLRQPSKKAYARDRNKEKTIKDKDKVTAQHPPAVISQESTNPPGVDENMDKRRVSKNPEISGVASRKLNALRVRQSPKKKSGNGRTRSTAVPRNEVFPSAISKKSAAKPGSVVSQKPPSTHILPGIVKEREPT
ncbi:PREDICTED: uncharacterized protein LOC104710966 [Camelina sativa]|uniref:Uncharacterized protein LOC104710966 n=1 Tax=Camelina sativa TaxID=90675 RepID=A0ABM0TG62_CAMSA|nr:PREDICTED: uncharacterized protein LOC104710966 [Camelina sativa]